ncbi:MAG: hypothetical protein HF962_09465 [Sulfurovum sp.]|nr:hypothetical protein [Sulfurovum sp.]
MNILKKAVLLATVAIVPIVSVQAEDKTLNVGLFWMPSNIDPAVKWNGWMLPRIGIGENLIRVNEKLEFEPSIAKSWKIIDDKTVTFEIRDGVVFHDGKTLTAEDVKKSIERAIKTTGRKDVKFPLESITIEGNKMTIKTSEPFPTLVNVLAESCLYHSIGI